ncbi:MAG: hypothetical protein IPG82_20095 [Saprospiraceae bacterium]|nr:hypothetical protein [Saprospiraceae bacterium]MBP9136431.1 hypothetical protein [Chitinophagales bacterium]
MANESDILRIKLMFKGLNKVNSATTFPPVNSLAKTLNSLVDNDHLGDIKFGINVDNFTIAKFATASIEMWHRSLHSFFISASLTKASPLWSSVAGYYSSHYAIRAFAHLFGYYQLYNKKRIVQLELTGQNYSCNFSKRGSSDREHTVYWKFVKNYFTQDPFFYLNLDTPPTGQNSEFRSDSGHRNRANYADHIGKFPVFAPLDSEDLKTRIYKLSVIEINDVPIPDVNGYPDIDNVQLIAYHRILKFRVFVDEILTSNNRFWNLQRNPTWAPSYFDFQAVSVDYSGILSSLIS